METNACPASLAVLSVTNTNASAVYQLTFPPFLAYPVCQTVNPVLIGNFAILAPMGTFRAIYQVVPPVLVLSATVPLALRLITKLFVMPVCRDII
jgi:hypothetical protein